MRAWLRGRVVFARRGVGSAIVAILGVGVGACGGTTGRENITETGGGSPESGIGVDAAAPRDGSAASDAGADAGSAADAIPYADAITYVDVAGYQLPDAGPDTGGGSDGGKGGGNDAAANGPLEPASTDGILALIVDGSVAPYDGAPMLLSMDGAPLPDAGSDCFQCAAMNACDDLNGGTSDDCEDFGDAAIPANTPGGGGGLSAAQLCLDTLWCVFQNGKQCINSGNAQNCLCGDSGPALCTSMYSPGIVQNGPCWRQEVEGLETDNASLYSGVFTTSTLPAGRANNMVVCLSTSGCSSCFSQ